MKWIEETLEFKTEYTIEKAQKILDLCLSNGWEANSHDGILTMKDFEEDGVVKKGNKRESGSYEYYTICIYKGYIFIEDCDYGNEIIKLLEEGTNES